MKEITDRGGERLKFPTFSHPIPFQTQPLQHINWLASFFLREGRGLSRCLFPGGLSGFRKLLSPPIPKGPPQPRNSSQSICPGRSLAQPILTPVATGVRLGLGWSGREAPFTWLRTSGVRFGWWWWFSKQTKRYGKEAQTDSFPDPILTGQTNPECSSP